MGGLVIDLRGERRDEPQGTGERESSQARDRLGHLGGLPGSTALENGAGTQPLCPRGGASALAH